MKYAVTITQTYVVLVDASCKETALEIAASRVGAGGDNLKVSEALPIRAALLPPAAPPRD